MTSLTPLLGDRPGSCPGRGVRDRPGHLLAAVRGPARSASRATSAASRSASRRWVARSSPRGWWTRPRPPAPRATASRPRRSISSSATPSPTPPRARCSRWRRRRGRRWCCWASSRRRRSTTPTPTRASGWPTARPAACPRSRARSRAPASPTTPSPARSTTTSARGRRSAAGSAPPASRGPCEGRASAFSGTPIRACSTSTPTSPPCMPRSARTSRCWRSTTSARAWRGASDDEVRAKVEEIRAMFAFADPSADPIAGPIEDEALDWSARVAVGLDRLAADFELDALTYYYRGIDGNEAERLGRRRDRRQLAADRARDPDRGRGRPQDQPRAADPRPPRRRRLLHRVLRARLLRGLHPHGPRRAGARRDRPGAADAARAQALPRQARRRAERRAAGPLRARSRSSAARRPRRAS